MTKGLRDSLTWQSHSTRISAFMPFVKSRISTQLPQLTKIARHAAL
jgi:hypothetical protein